MFRNSVSQECDFGLNPALDRFQTGQEFEFSCFQAFGIQNFNSSADMGVFNFKRFAVVNERSAMKVNTDGVLLGAAMTIRETDRMMLDVGTGTGTIALMAAQRWADRQLERCSERLTEFRNVRLVECRNECQGEPYHFLHPELDSGSVKGDTDVPNQVWDDVNQVWIDAIDIDEASAQEAGMNFEKSPWGGNMRAYHCSLDEFALTDTSRRYDLIFSNPPYFEDSLLAPEERRCNARHTTGLSYRELIEFSAERLAETGRFSIVLPADQEAALTRYARMNGLHLFRIVRIKTVPRKAPNRIIAEFSRQRCEVPQEEILTIQNEGKYTQEYLSLTRDFYLFA